MTEGQKYELHFCPRLYPVVITLIEKLTQAGGYRYLKARRPDLYRDIIGQEHVPEQKVVWLKDA